MAVAEAPLQYAKRLWPLLVFCVALTCVVGAVVDTYGPDVHLTGDVQCLRDRSVVSILSMAMYGTTIVMETLLVMLVFAHASTNPSLFHIERLCLCIIALNCVMLGGQVRLLAQQLFSANTVLLSGAAGVLGAAAAAYIVQCASVPTLLRRAPDFDFGTGGMILAVGGLQSLVVLVLRSNTGTTVAWAVAILACVLKMGISAPGAPGAHSAHIAVFSVYFFILCTWFEMLVQDCMRVRTGVMSVQMLILIVMHVLGAATWGAPRYYHASYDSVPTLVKPNSQV